MQIVFVTAGGTEMGMGHVFRTITLAKELVSRADITFISNNDEIVAGAIRQAGFRLVICNNNGEIKSGISRLGPVVTIFDILQVDENLAKEIKNSTKSNLVIFENQSAANRFASVVVNAVLDTRFQNCSYVDQTTGTRYFYGPRYWILRPEFYEHKHKTRILNQNPARITLAFGGSDPANLSSKVLRELFRLDQVLQIDICLGIHFMYLNELQSVLAGNDSRDKNIKTYINPGNMAELMYNSDLVITSPGTCAVEALFIGTPIISITQNMDQDEAYKGYLNTINEGQLPGIKQLIETGNFIYPYQKNIHDAEIGEGKGDVLQAIMDLQEPIRSLEN